MFRFRHLTAMREFGSAACKGKSPGSGLARQLFACLGEAPDIIKTVTQLLQLQEQDTSARRSCDPSITLVEVIAVLHDGHKEATITRIAELTNALLRSRGETLEHSQGQLVWKLRKFRLVSEAWSERDDFALRSSARSNLGSSTENTTA
jgi:hypothetical protein